MSDDSALGAITHISVHHVGNKGNEESMVLSEQPLRLNVQLTDALMAYFKAPLKTEAFFHLHHESSLELNEVYAFVNAIFKSPDALHEQSVNLAKHLFACSTHPNIKGGEFYTVYFQDCVVEGELLNAVGLFKSENKDTFLKVQPDNGNFNVFTDMGVNIKKLDKGCLIFNTESEQGYVVAVVDNTNKSSEAHYWMDDFLCVKQREDSYYQTHNVLSMAKSFITKELPEQFDVSKADQAELLNKSINFFKRQESFNMEDFEAEVIVHPDVIDQFKQFKNDYQQEREMYIADAFDISAPAVKSQQRVFKSILKLDKNFSVYIHGDKNLIERGTDPDGRKFYKLYYKEER